VEKVGREDSFFELGGHSLLATQLVSRLEAQFAIPLPLSVIFHSATLKALAEAIEAQSPDKQAEEGERVIKPCRRDQPMPLSFAQQRLWFLYQVSPQDPFYNMPFAIRFSAIEPALLAKTVQTIVNRHEKILEFFNVKRRLFFA
jgi:acyl carrier protein